MGVFYGFIAINIPNIQFDISGANALRPIRVLFGLYHILRRHIGVYGISYLVVIFCCLLELASLAFLVGLMMQEHLMFTC